MTAEIIESGNRSITGRFVSGVSPNPRGRPKKGLAIRDILKSVPLKDKKLLVQTAYEKALEGDVHWAEWIAKHSGEGSTTTTEVNIDNRTQVLVHEVRGVEVELG